MEIKNICESLEMLLRVGEAVKDEQSGLGSYGETANIGNINKLIAANLFWDLNRHLTKGPCLSHCGFVLTCEAFC